MKRVMIIFGVAMVLVGGTMIGCGKSKGEKSEVEKKEKENSSSLIEEKKSIKSSKEFRQESLFSPAQHKNIVLKWAHEEIGESGTISVHHRRLGSKISKEGILYVDVAGPEGPKLYAIDIPSGEILKNKEIKSEYRLLGISQKAIYFATFSKYKNIIESLLAFNRVNWAPLWERNLEELKISQSIWLTEKGIIYSRTIRSGEESRRISRAGSMLMRSGLTYTIETGLLDEVAGQFQPFPEPVRSIALNGRSLGNENLVSSTHFKALLIDYARSFSPESREDGYSLLVLDLSTGQVLSEKKWPGEGLDSPRVLGLCEADGKFFVTSRKKGMVHPSMTCIEMDTGEIKWETEELLIDYYGIFAGATEKIVLVYGKVKQRDIPYTLWYGIDTITGKILWKKWAKIDYEKGTASSFFMDPYHVGNVWTEVVGEILLIAKGNLLILVDALTGEIITQQEEFPMAKRFRQHTVYKDMLIIGTANGLRAYQIKR